jgi:predicted nucleotidyltransferase
VNQIIDAKRQDIALLCRQHHVLRLAAFGSVLRSDFDPAGSDIDLLVEFEPLSTSQYAQNYFIFLDALTQLFSRKVDLLVWTSIKNPYFRDAVNSSQELLYAA